jgi:hypothetical protein
MSKPTELRIAINKNLYGDCASIVAYRDNVEIGRAVKGAYPKPNWLIGPSGIPNADDFDITLEISPAWTVEQMLVKVETALRLSISAAEAFGKVAA